MGNLIPDVWANQIIRAHNERVERIKADPERLALAIAMGDDLETFPEQTGADHA